LGTSSPTPEELGRIQDYCEKLGYDKVNYAATWKIVGEKPFAYSYCSVQDEGIEQFVVVGYQNQTESVTMNQMLIAEEATVDGRTYQVAGIIDPKDGVYKAIITVDPDGNQAAFDLRDASNMVIVPPKGDNGIGDQVKGFLEDFFIESALAAELEPTLTPEVGVEPTATAMATSVPTDEIPNETATATAEVAQVVFSEKLKNQGEGITIQISEGARKIGETVYGEPIESFLVTSEALTKIREDFINLTKELYVNTEHIAWNDRMEFLVSENSEIKWNGSSFVVDSDPSKHWDTNKLLNLFAVTKEEIEIIKDDLKIKDPEAKYYFGNFSILDGEDILIYNDETGATNAYSTIDKAVDDNFTNRSGSSVMAFTFIGKPVGAFRQVIITMAIKIGKRTGFSYSSNYLYEDLGCNLYDSMDSCSALTINQ